MKPLICFLVPFAITSWGAAAAETHHHGHKIGSVESHKVNGSRHTLSMPNRPQHWEQGDKSKL
jgi:hypothetical protein